MITKKTFGMLTLLVMAVALPATGQLSGAIYTTDGFGVLVNGNVYPSKDDVHLNGGPPPNAPCTSGGLLDGDYYFQVTDPSGTVLLSTDGIEDRRVRVVGGFIVLNLGSHLTGVGKCPGSISVQLLPYDDTPNPGGEYKVWMTPVGDFSAGSGVFGFIPQSSKTDNFKVRRADNGEEPVAIIGAKFYDTNTNGLWDQPDEPPIPGWRIEKMPPEPADVTFTAATGEYSFLVEPNSGEYTITEVPPPPGFFPDGEWINTTPTSGIVVVGSVDVVGPDFGNVCLGPGGGRTKGFWSNKNGKKLVGADDLALLVGLNLRNRDGTHFDPSSYAQFRNWLRNADAVNMAYMLSVQLAAMALNVHNGFVDGNALVYAPGATSANAAGFATVNDLMAEADAELGLHGTAFPSDSWRDYQEALKDALDNANNNETFVQSAPCPFDSPY